MNRGILVYAFNNGVLNYLKQALWLAERAERFLGLPTTLVTNEVRYTSSVPHEVIIQRPITASTRIFNPTAENALGQWYNANRYQAFFITPYDETIVLDSDYVINSDRLNLLFDSPSDFLCHRRVYDVANKNSLVAYDRFGGVGLPHYWATVMFFRNTEFSNTIFSFISDIRENYDYYSKLYKFRPEPFRNDFALSIALSIVYGHRLSAIPTIPWDLPTAVSDISAMQLEDTTFELTYEKQYRNKVRPMSTIIKDQDFHMFNKVALEKIIDAGC